VAGLAGLIGAGLTKLGTPGRVEAVDGDFVRVGVVVSSDNPSTMPTGILAVVQNALAMAVSNGSGGSPPELDLKPEASRASPATHRRQGYAG